MKFRKLINYIRRVLNREDYFHLLHRVSDKLNVDYPLNYYFDFRPKINYKGRFDSKGVMLVFDYDENTWVYFPISIFNYGMAAVQCFIETKDEKYRRIFLAQADWAVSNQKKKNAAGAWQNEFKNRTYNLESGWISGISQGMGISFLLRVWLLSGNKKYLNCAIEAIKPYLKHVNEGGIRIFYRDRFVFFEEYPSEPPSFVLNGFITSLLGLRDLYVFEGNRDAKTLWDHGLVTLKNILPDYDLGYWSRYDLRKGKVNIASSFYHCYHIEQLKLMSMFDNDNVFREYYKRFQKYNRNIINKFRAYGLKILWRLKKL